MSACPSEDVLLSFAEQKLPVTMSAEVGSHLDGCSDCRIIVSELARSLEASHPKADGPLRPLLARGSSLGRYLVLEQVGAGGMGVVYAAYDPSLDRRVAVKVLRETREEKQRDRLVQEARTMARLSHPNVAQVYGVETLGDRVFVTMEFIVGETGRRWAMTERTVAQVLDVFLQAGRGIEAAHAAGIVHRDFKPDNLMVRADGRVSVLDFGLARPSGESVAGSGAAPSTPTSLTETGTVMGTLRYMPPEQRLGKATDARADQYAFCVSLHEVLFGAPPGEPAKRSVAVSGRVLKAIARGLEPEPSDRFEDMHALLAELEQARAPARRSGVAVAAAVLLAAAGAGVFYLQRGPEPCSGSRDELAAAWNSERRSAIETAFAGASGGPAVLAALDGYGAKWEAAHQQACVATRVQGVQSEELLDRRMLCLAARRAALGAMAERIGTGGAALAKAPSAVASLPSIDDCSDAQRLLETVPPPSDVEVRARLFEVRDALARVRATRELGRVDEALTEATKVVESAEGVGYAPLLAEALWQRTELLRASAMGDDSEASGWRGVHAALASRDLKLQAEAWLALSETVGVILRRPVEAEKLFGVAKAAVGALPHPGVLEGHWLRAYGQFREMNNDVKQALASYEAAIALFSKLPDAPKGIEVRLLRRICDTQLLAQHLPEAEAAARKAVAFGEAEPLGTGSLDLSLMKLGEVLNAQRKYDEARPVLKRALALAKKGSNRFLLAAMLNVLGDLERATGHFDAAADAYQQFIALVEQLPAPNPYLAVALGGLGVTQVAAKDPQSGERSLRKAVALFEKIGMRDDFDVVEVRLAWVEALTKSGDKAMAWAELQRALEVLEASAKMDPGVLAPQQFNAAERLAELGRLPAKAKELATAAMAATPEPRKSEIARWLEQHR